MVGGEDGLGLRVVLPVQSLFKGAGVDGGLAGVAGEPGLVDGVEREGGLGAEGGELLKGAPGALVSGVGVGVRVGCGGYL